MKDGKKTFAQNIHQSVKIKRPICTFAERKYVAYFIDIFIKSELYICIVYSLKL